MPFLGIPKAEIYNNYAPNSTRKNSQSGKIPSPGSGLARMPVHFMPFWMLVLLRGQGVEELGQIDQVVQIELLVDGMYLVHPGCNNSRR